MARYTGGMQVAGGYYWNPRKWEVEVVAQEGARLKGPAEAKYVKLPFPVLFVVVPLLGALFLMFLPLIGFALFGYAIVKKVTGGVKQGATELASTMAPGGFATGEAHFTGKPGEEKKGEAPRNAELEKLEKEIEAKRTEKK
ncbi:MAG TPA: hypothetical protein VF841_10820 [Anaeromyxobacter sp.]